MSWEPRRLTAKRLNVPAISLWYNTRFPAARVAGGANRDPGTGLPFASRLPMLDINRIREILPHRYPMLLIDRIEDMGEDWIVGIKNVSINEPFFEGHFPKFPVMPGVLIIESMAQVGGVLLLDSQPGGKPDPDSQLVLFTGIDHAKFRKPVFPGDQLRIELKILKRKRTVFKMSGKATVDGKLVAEAVLMCQLVGREALRPPPPSSPSSSSSSEPPDAGGS